MYIPFVSLLGLQAAVESLVFKKPAPEPALIAAEDFIDPRNGGGSLLDHDSGGLGEPLNVSLFPFPPPSFGTGRPNPFPPDGLSLLALKLKKKRRLLFQGSAIRGSSQMGALCILRVLSDCELLID
jgi:hypothetical protein